MDQLSPPPALDQLRWIYEFHDWANGRIFSAFKQLVSQQRSQPGVIPGGNEDGSLHATLAHLLGAEVIWLERWLGNAHAPLPGASDYPSPEALESNWGDLTARRRSWLLNLQEDHLAHPVEYMSIAFGVMERFPLWQTLLQVSNHSAHHRGEAAAALTGFGRPPPSVDLTDYMRSR